jgi:hypothetical protein
MKLILAGGILAAHLLSFGTPITSTSAADAVYVVNNSASPHIDEYTTAGVFVRTLSGGPANVLFWNGLAFGADGYLYATDTFNCISNNCDNELEKFDPRTGAYLGAVGSINASTVPYSGVTNMAVSLNGLALGPGGSLYVTTNQLGLYKIDPVGNNTIPISTAGCCTYGVAFMPDGTPLSVDASQNAIRNDLTGTAFNTGFFTSAIAVAFGPDGRLYILQDHQIDALPSTGGAITPLTALNALSLGAFETFDEHGNIWVTDRDNGVVEFNSVTGQEITSFAAGSASEFSGIAVGPYSSVSPVPESSTFALTLTALLIATAFYRRKNLG